MASTPRPYPSSVVEWGESGSFSPCLRPSGECLVQLREFQREIESEHPEALLSPELFLPFFECDPKALFEYIKGTAKPNLDERVFYKDMASMFGYLIIGHANLRVEISGIEMVGDEEPSIAIKLGETANFSFLAEKAQDLFEYTLIQRTKLSAWVLEGMCDDPDIGRSFEIPEPRILVATNLGAAALSSIESPGMVHFNEIGDGSSSLGGPENRQWYMKRL